MRVGHRVAVIGGALVTMPLLLGISGSAGVFDAPFNFGQLNRIEWQGSFLEGEARSNANGLIEVQLRTSNWAIAEIHQALGSKFVVNAGPTLSSFSAPVSVQAYAQGLLYCSRPEHLAEISFSILVYQFDGNWFLNQEGPRQSYKCPTASSLSLDTPIDLSSTFMFQAGRQYAVTLGLNSRLVQDNLCINPPICSANPSVEFLSSGPSDPQSVRLRYISLPNQAPQAHAIDITRWYAANLVGGTNFAGVVCDYDGRIMSANITYTSKDVTAAFLAFGVAEQAPNAPCGYVSLNWRILTPSVWTTWVSGTDDGGFSSSDQGEIRVVLLPPEHVTALSRIDTQVVEQLTYSAHVDSNGAILDWNIETNKPLMPALNVANAGFEHLYQVHIDARHQMATAYLDGIAVWSASIRADWWNSPIVGLRGSGFP